MECRGHQISLPHQHRVTIAAGEDLDFGSGLDDAGGADEDHLQRIARQGSRRSKDGGVDLASVGVALHHGIEQAERALRGVLDIARQQNCTGASAEDGLLSGEVAQFVEEMPALEELEHGSGFAAGQDQAVQLIQLLRVADFNRVGSGVGERGGVGGVVSLNGQHADAGTFFPMLALGLAVAFRRFFSSQSLDRVPVPFAARGENVVAQLGAIGGEQGIDEEFLVFVLFGHSGPHLAAIKTTGRHLTFYWLRYAFAVCQGLCKQGRGAAGYKGT